MLETTKKMVELIDEMMEVVDELFSISMFGEMDDEMLKMMKLYMKSIDLSKEYMLKQAGVIDEQSKKLDLILSKLEEKES